ncbi:MAG: hypothetical protein COB02_13525 [Candidatus Cloacimonadota bacterium]|nr:MAG: hypothetical protein COB02_13525 [Candidatus Cloacimonadota bacterium]
MTPSICPCNSQLTYDKCCEPFHKKVASPLTAQSLMCSRYSAYVYKNSDYLYQTTHPSVRNKDLKKDIISWIKQVSWLSLEIVETKLGTQKDKIGKVEFIAEYTLDNQSHHHHELSNFKKHKSQWMYVDGIIY